MRLQYLSVGILLILLNVSSCLARIKSRNSKTNVQRKPSSSVPKTNVPAKTGLLLYKGGLHPIQLNQTDENGTYAANYSMFPDGLVYPRLSSDKDVEEFLTACMNTTLQADINSVRLSQIRSNGEVYTRVVTHVIEFLCLDNFYRVPGSAYQLSGGLWELLLASLICILHWVG